MLSNYLKKSKAFIVEHQDRIILTVGIVLIALISFGLGRLYDIRNAKKPIFIEDPVTLPHQPPDLPINQTNDARNDITAASGTTEQEQNSRMAAVVASKNGTKYHLPDCPGAKQIKPENKIEFSSAKEAEAAGYKPAGNCHGLKVP